MSVVDLTATLTLGNHLTGVLTNGPPLGVQSFSDTDTVVVTHNRLRVLQFVKVFVQLSSFGNSNFNSDDYSVSSSLLEELSSDHFSVSFSEGLDSFTVSLDNVYTGEIRFS